MSCEDFKSDLLLHADGELRGQPSLKLLAHLQHCPACGRQLIAHQQFQASIARVMGDLKAPVKLQATILSVLEADAREEALANEAPASESPARRPRGRAGASRPADRIRIPWPAAIAAAVALAFVAVWQYQPWAETIDPAANLQPVRVTDEGPVAIELARDVHKLHIKCATLGPGHQDAGLPQNAQAAATQMGSQLGIPVLSGDRLRLDVGQARFESAHICPLHDSNRQPHSAAHLVYRNRADEPISLFSTRSFPDLTGLQTRSINGRSYVILAPGLSTKCHPFTIVIWNADRASYLVCAPFADEETMQYVEPLRLALERDPSLGLILLAALDR